jgi:hypothetical protein
MKTLSSRLRIYASLIALAPMFGAISVLADPPGNSGPYVSRQENGQLVVLIQDNGMQILVGDDPVQACLAQHPVPEATWDFLIINNPTAVGLIMGVAQNDDIVATIWPEGTIVPGAPWITCPNVLNSDPIARGAVDATVTTNDFLGNAPNRAATAHWSFHGVLESPSGDPVMVTGGTNCAGKGATYTCGQRISVN